MAIDSEQKRKSIATVATPWNGPSIVPSGSFDQADRQHIGWSYSGIAAATPGAFVFPIFSEAGIHSLIFGGAVVR